MNDYQKKLLEQEYKRLSVEVMELFKSILSTEQYAVGAAATVAAFLLTDLAMPSSEHAILLSVLPLTILVLGALRSLSLFWAMMNARRYFLRIETEVLRDLDLGLHKSGTFSEARNISIVTTVVFWVIAICSAIYFAVTYSVPDT
jgi:hypothetical protein